MAKLVIGLLVSFSAVVCAGGNSIQNDELAAELASRHNFGIIPPYTMDIIRADDFHKIYLIKQTELNAKLREFRHETDAQCSRRMERRDSGKVKRFLKKLCCFCVPQS